MTYNPKIIIRDFEFFYGDERVIHGINLNIPENEILSVLGPAKSGITTLLRSLNRLSDLTPSARIKGEVLLDGQDINAPGVSVTDLRRRVGMVFDVPTPLPLSIYDNVAYGPKLIGNNSKKELDEIVELALTQAALWDDVKDRLDIAAASLSGGQQQRLCIARTLALKPEVILLDRPCSGLDPISTAKIEDSLNQLKEQLTVIIAPHNVQQAGRISDRVVFMLLGELIEEGTNLEIFGSPKDQRTSDYITGRFG
jgi:phosphate transport system ATP-binding protein